MSGGVCGSRRSPSRRSNIDRNRLVGRSGEEASGERTLAFFIAHEITHSLEANYLGRYAYWRLPVWKREGYADYVARGADFHFQEQLAAFQRNARETDFERSGLYLRYQLLVAHLLDNRRITPEVLLREPFNQDSLERELRGMK